MQRCAYVSNENFYDRTRMTYKYHINYTRLSNTIKQKSNTFRGGLNNSQSLYYTLHNNAVLIKIRKSRIVVTRFDKSSFDSINLFHSGQLYRPVIIREIENFLNSKRRPFCNKLFRRYHN